MADIVIVPNTDNPVQVNVSQQTQTISVSVPDINVLDISAGLTITLEGGGGGGTGATNFLQLTDTPDSYLDQGDKFVAVNTGGTAITFVDAPTGGGVSSLNSLTGPLTLTEGNDNIVITPSGSSIELEVKPQQVVENVKNMSGGPLSKGTPLHIIGNAGNTSQVVAANANALNPKSCHLILNEDLANEAEGEAIAIGFINNVSVGTGNAGDYSPSDEVWLADGGGYTTTRPTGSGTLVQKIGVILNVNTNQDTISGIVFGTFIEEHLPNLRSGYTWRGDVNGYPQEYDLDHLISRVTANEGGISSNDSDIIALQGADTTLQGNIDAEEAARISADNTLTSNYNLLKTYVVDTDTDKIVLTRNDPNNALTIDKSTGSEKIVLTSAGVDVVEVTDTGVSTRGITISDAGSVTPAPFTLPSRDGSDGQVLKTDGSGNVSWSAAPLSSLSIVGLTAAGDYDSRSDVWVYGGGTTTAGLVHYLTSSGTWSGTDANAVSTASGMLCVAAGSDPDVDGVVVKGFVRMSSDSGGNVGDPVYLSETTGLVTTTAPTTSGAVVRVVGYKVALNIIYFNPSQDWIEIA